MARSLATLKENTLKIVETASTHARTALFYGFIPVVLYLGFSTEPKPNVRALLGMI